MTLTKYGTLCTQVYEITKPIDADYPDVPYYIRHLSAMGGKVLEVMVGTGRLLIPLLPKNWVESPVVLGRLLIH
jgi:hypothetical protein